MFNMFPEVFFIDVTCCTNHQNKQFFLMVVKDTNGETQVDNISVLLFEKKWVFNEMFKHIFVEFYEEHMICRNFSMLTDKDSAAYDPIINSIATRVEHQQNNHMLRMSHALAKKLKEKSIPKCPIYLNGTS